MIPLPLEILDCILGYHKEREPLERPRWHNLGRHSKTLLACHKVSKQFRACALRHICKSISIPLYDTPKHLRRLQDMIFEEVNPELGSLALFVKEVDIITIQPQDVPVDGHLRRKQLKVHKAALLQMLNSVVERIAIRKLSITGSGVVRIDWKFLHSSIRNALVSLLQLPSVSSLHLEYIQHLPAQFLAANVHLRFLSIARCWDIQILSSFAASLPELEQLNLQHMDDFPAEIKLSSLRTANVQHHTEQGLDTSWSIIKRASKTLRNIIYNGLDITPPPFNIASFPTLETFVYSPGYTVTCSHIKTRIRFFQVSQPVPNIRLVQLSYRLYSHRASHRSTLSSSIFDKGWTELDDTWKELDRAFGSGHFTGLQKLHIKVEMPIYLRRLNDETGPSEFARAHILDVFYESRSRLLPIEVEAIFV